jgi:hypothetical protein
METYTNQERITLVYDCIEYEDELGYYISFGDDIGVYIIKSLSFVDNEAMTIEMPLWLAVAKEIEMYEE